MGQMDMKKAGLGVGIFIAAFAGVFAALRIDRVMEKGDVLSRVESSGSMPISRTEYEAGAPFDFRSAAKKVMPSVVSVDKTEAMRNFFEEEVMVNTGTGSGVIISADGYVVTNNHVVANASKITVRLNDGHSYDAKLIGTDPRADIAVIKMQGGNNFQAAELADSSKTEIGQWVMAVGNPLGYDNTLSVGVISSLNRTLTAEDNTVLSDTIQTDASINQGNSGGALTNDRGQVIGINSAIASPSGGSVGIGFAIPINRAKKTIADLIKLGHVPYGDPGFTVFQVGISDPRARRSFRNLTDVEPPKSGVIVSRLWGNAAAKAGLEQFDVVTQVDGKPVNSPIDWTKALLDKRAGEKLTLITWRKGKTETLTYQLPEGRNY